MKALKIKLFQKLLGKFCNSSLTYKDFKLTFYHLKAVENKEFCIFELTISDIFSNLVKFPDFFQKSPFFPDLVAALF